MADDERNNYLQLCHAMQSGVAAKMNYAEPGGECSPKHLRVGVNVAMSDHGALVALLIEKGLITLAEYERFAATKMADEVTMYEVWLSNHTGGNIKLK